MIKEKEFDNMYTPRYTFNVEGEDIIWSDDNAETFTDQEATDVLQLHQEIIKLTREIVCYGK